VKFNKKTLPNSAKDHQKLGIYGVKKDVFFVENTNSVTDKNVENENEKNIRTWRMQILSRLEINKKGSF